MQSLAIVGVGLIGGSVGLALRKAGFTGPILGVSSPRSIETALELGAIDRGASLEEALGSVDVVYLAQPIGGILDTLGRMRGLLRHDTLVTDAGSTKLAICRKAETELGPGRFLGGHPMAGKASRGVSAADAELFRGRTYVLCPSEYQDGTDASTREFTSWLTRCGAKIVLLDPEKHDTLVALTSHLPQVASTALASVIASLSDTELDVSGPGLRDMTRLALSSYDIWHDIFASNSGPVEHALTVYIDKLTELRDNLQTQRLGEIFRLAADTAGRLRR